MCGHGHGILTLVALVNIHVQADRKRLAWPYMKVGELWLEAVLSNNLPRAGKGGAVPLKLKVGPCEIH